MEKQGVVGSKVDAGPLVEISVLGNNIRDVSNRSGFTFLLFVYWFALI